jgi:hypothetical protein
LGSVLEVCTGPLTFVVSAGGHFPLHAATMAGRDVLPDGALHTDLHIDGQAYVLRPAGPLVLEEAGPLRAVVRIEGRAVSHDGRQSLDATARIYAWAGHSTLRIYLTLTNRLPSDWRTWMTGRSICGPSCGSSGMDFWSPLPPPVTARPLSTASSMAVSPCAWIWWTCPSRRGNQPAARWMASPPSSPAAPARNTLFNPETRGQYRWWEYLLHAALQKHTFNVQSDTLMGFSFFDYGDFWRTGRGGQWYNNEMDKGYGLILQMVRTGYGVVMEHIEPIIHHQIDVDTIHDADQDWQIGAQRYHFAKHGSMLPPSLCHEWIEGPLFYYLLTGYRRAEEVAIARIIHESRRENEHYQDPRYLATCEEIVDWLDEWRARSATGWPH